jgi:hypothetical protein
MDTTPARENRDGFDAVVTLTLPLPTPLWGLMFSHDGSLDDADQAQPPVVMTEAVLVMPLGGAEVEGPATA